MSVALRFPKIIIAGTFAILIAFLGYEILHKNWLSVFVVGQALILCSIPYFLSRKYGIYTPQSLYAGIVLFMFATLVLGEVHQFYVTYWWWDIVLHMFAGLGVAIIGFIILLAFFTKKDLRNSAGTVSLYVIGFSLAFAVFWEIYEFIIDHLFPGGNAMQSDGSDTMWDLITATCGALVAASFGYAYLRMRYTKYIASVIEEGEEENKK